MGGGRGCATARDRLADLRTNQTHLELYSETVLVTRVNRNTEITWQLQRKYNQETQEEFKTSG